MAEIGVRVADALDDRDVLLIPHRLDVRQARVQAELVGFLTEVRSGIRLTVGREAAVDFTLGLGQVAESIQVTGEAPLIETTRSEMGGVVSTEQVSTLPLNARDFAQLMTLQAGAIPSGPNAAPGFSLYRGRSAVMRVSAPGASVQIRMLYLRPSMASTLEKPQMPPLAAP